MNPATLYSANDHKRGGGGARQAVIIAWFICTQWPYALDFSNEKGDDDDEGNDDEDNIWKSSNDCSFPLYLQQHWSSRTYFYP